MHCFYIPTISQFHSLLTIISLGLWLNTKAAPNYVSHFCSNQTTFAPNSTYQSNLNSVLSSLSSKATTCQFYNATAATVRDPSATSYGLFLCRGNVSSEVCQECVVYDTSDVVKRCPVEMVAVIWYDQCLLRYSNRYFFGTMDQVPTVILRNTANVTDQSRFNELLEDTIKAAAEAAAEGGPKKFATRVANFSEFHAAMVRTEASCSARRTCLVRIVTSISIDIAIGRLPSCCNGKNEGQILMLGLV